MNDTPSLFAECPLPGCTNPVDDPRWPCGDCEAALAGYIRPAAQPVTAEEATAMLAERDQAVATCTTNLYTIWERKPGLSTGLLQWRL